LQFTAAIGCARVDGTAAASASSTAHARHIALPRSACTEPVEAAPPGPALRARAARTSGRASSMPPGATRFLARRGCTPTRSHATCGPRNARASGATLPCVRQHSVSASPAPLGGRACWAAVVRQGRRGRGFALARTRKARRTAAAARWDAPGAGGQLACVDTRGTRAACTGGRWRGRGHGFRDHDGRRVVYCRCAGHSGVPIDILNQSTVVQPNGLTVLGPEVGALMAQCHSRATAGAGDKGDDKKAQPERPGRAPRKGASLQVLQVTEGAHQ
jgi:hypothetical protein